MSFIAIDGDTRRKVKRVVIDFNAQYQSVIRKIFPEAKMIADNFHLVQMGLQALNQTRVQLMHHFAQNSREYRILKHHWRLFLKTYSDLNQRTYLVAHFLVDILRNHNYSNIKSS
ncbi:ISL3 family transposase [Liquorilactobacillus capillatus]|uniref:ISL3 family transposase n=1 Tax=Liquorilactobacillus capillatus TaxID=480931 RepID=UPI00070B751F|nr:ISL3 family transposase [Liquorilactobacillus capillatus]